MISSYFTIRAYDEALRGFVTEHMQSSDKIRIIGELDTTKAIDQNQKSRSAGFIRAKSIETHKTNAAKPTSWSDEEYVTDAEKPGRD